MRRGWRLALRLGLAAIAAGTACASISDGSRSLSKSVSSPSRSSSERSDPPYMREIRSYSYGYARAGGDPEAFARGVSSLAERGGVQVWEEDEHTCRAVGEGFRDAGVGTSSAKSALAKVVPAESPCGLWMRAGYHERAD
jgi:hypothetical protein